MHFAQLDLQVWTIKVKFLNKLTNIQTQGHHSGEAETCTGFCFFNNVVIGAKYAIEKYKAKRVAIVDWDIHFGDGTFHLV